MIAAARRPILRAALAATLIGLFSPVLAAEAPSAEPEASADPVVVNARIVGDEKRARFIADLTREVAVGVFTLADPYRIVVDLPEVRFQLPDSAGQSGRGLLTAFRFGQLSPGKSRIVLDLASPVKVEQSFVVKATDGQPARLVIDVVPTTRTAFLVANQAYRDALRVEEAAKRDRALVTRDKPKGEGLTIVLDPGHGGIDMGAKGRRAVEKDVTLAFSKVLGAKLEKTGLYDVVYTRTDDSFVALGDRVSIARTHGANLFISIHANIFRGQSVRGAIIYTISEDATDKMAAEIAESENQSDVLAGLDEEASDSDEVRDILFDLTRRETRNFGVVFAKNLVQELKTSTRMFKIPHQQARFKVLEAHDVPSAMIELGFMSNGDDEKLLLSDAWREKAADSIVRAIADYFAPQMVQKGTQ